jgi:hypothetical protein
MLVTGGGRCYHPCRSSSSSRSAVAAVNCHVVVVVVVVFCLLSEFIQTDKCCLKTTFGTTFQQQLIAVLPLLLFLSEFILIETDIVVSGRCCCSGCLAVRPKRLLLQP